jgi:diguanylate cyclase (GGDEF)-like protein
VSGRAPERATDPFAVEFRISTLRTGVWPTMLVCAYCAAYFARTWDQPHRWGLTAILVAAFVSAVAIALLPMERILSGAWREPFFISWSASVILFVTVAVGLDGGLRSPLLPLFFLPLAYASLSYPFASMLAVGAVNLGSFLALSALTGAPSGDQVFVFSGALVSATVICAWQSHNHGRYRGELARASVTDPLTGCLNRRGFESRFDALLARSRDEGSELGLVVFDLDDFKAVNDGFGHAAGDDLLRWVADVLRATVRTGDVVGRFGGDEFAAAVDGTAAEAIAKRLTAALAERVSVSVGVAVFPRDGETADALHSAGDGRLYVAKRRNAPGHGARMLSR